MTGRKLTAILLAGLMVVCLLAGCGAKSMSYSTDDYLSAPGEAMKPETDGSFDLSEEMASETANALPTDRKLIKTVDIDAETEDLDALLKQLSADIGKQGGYIESQQLYNGSSYASSRNRYVNLTVRVPAENLEELVSDFAACSNIISREEDVEDVTMEYVSTETRIAALETEAERLLELMGKAETMADLLEIEARLTDVRYELEAYTARLKVLENQVSYSTIHLYISEVRQYTPVEEEEETFWQRVGSSNLRSLENIWYGITEFAAVLLGNLPYLLIIAAVTVGGVLLGRYFYRRTPKKQSDEEEKK